MRRTALLAALLAGAATFSVQPAAHACIGLPCDVINLVCRTAARADCVG